MKHKTKPGESYRSLRSLPDIGSLTSSCFAMKFSLSETILDNKEFIAACSAMLFGTGFVLLGCVVLK
ncbi:MAG: hypothetical protein ACK55Z_22950, partial [bacterium]